MIGLTGISYKTSPVELREQFSISKEEIIPFSELLQKETDISDIVVLSTCNRTEIYFSQDKYDGHLAAKLVYKTLKHFKGIESKNWHSFYSYINSDAVKHLFEVASGIDSMIIGEDQIIGELIFAFEKRKSYWEESSNGEINEDLKKVIRKCRKGGQFSITAVIQVKGEFIFVKRTFDVI